MCTRSIAAARVTAGYERNVARFSGLVAEREFAEDVLALAALAAGSSHVDRVPRDPQRTFDEVAQPVDEVGEQHRRLDQVAIAAREKGARLRLRAEQLAQHLAAKLPVAVDPWREQLDRLRGKFIHAAARYARRAGA